MSRLRVGVATVAVVVGVAGSVRAQVTPGPRRQPAPRPAAPADPSDTWDKHMSIGLEIGPGGVITTYDQAQSPSALLFYSGLRGSYDIVPAWSLGLVLRQWWLPSSNHATMLGLTARWQPKTWDWGRTYVDAALGATSTRYAWAFGFDVGGGIDWDIPDAPGLSIGPYLRYGQVLNPDRRTSDDGRAWTLGGAFTYHFGRAAAGEHADAASGRRSGSAFRLKVPDSDRDGIGDDEDLCKTVPQGNHPDPFKPGCPENDEDGDDVPDVDDACPVTQPGPNPDPKRPGCPLIDTDKDGIADPDDACPLKPGPANADPAHNGCPMGKKAAATPEEKENSGESPSAPSTVKKRSGVKSK
jgi:hypothetical protein